MKNPSELYRPPRRVTVYLYMLPDYLAITSESFLPIGMPKHQDRIRTGRLPSLGIIKRPAAA